MSNLQEVVDKTKNTAKGEVRPNTLAFVSDTGQTGKNYSSLCEALCDIYYNVQVPKIDTGFLILKDPNGAEIGIIATGAQLNEVMVWVISLT